MTAVPNANEGALKAAMAIKLMIDEGTIELVGSHEASTSLDVKMAIQKKSGMTGDLLQPELCKRMNAFLEMAGVMEVDLERHGSTCQMLTVPGYGEKNFMSVPGSVKETPKRKRITSKQHWTGKADVASAGTPSGVVRETPAKNEDGAAVRKRPAGNERIVVRERPAENEEGAALRKRPAGKKEVVECVQRPANVAEVKSVESMEKTVPSAPAPAPKVGSSASREQLVELLVSLLEKKPAAVEELGKRISAGRSLETKGVVFPTSMMASALAKYQSKAHGVTEIDNSPSPTKGVASPGKKMSVGSSRHSVQRPSRWVAPASSASALSSRAISECDNAEPFCCSVKVVGNKVAVLAKPNFLSRATGEYLQGDEVTEVIARAVCQRDGRVYLRLKKYAGWASTRSRKDFSKVVLVAMDEISTPLEPPSMLALTTSPATQLLKSLDATGCELPSANRESEISKEAAIFRVVVGRCQVLSTPSLTASSVTGASLQPKQQFLACGVHVNVSEGRAYLRLQEHAGWVSERLRADVHKFAVRPADSTTACDQDEDSRVERSQRTSATSKQNLRGPRNWPAFMRRSQKQGRSDEPVADADDGKRRKVISGAGG